MLAELVRDRCKWSSSTRLLDFGCGRHGNVAAALCQYAAETVAVDASAEAVAAFNAACEQQGLAASEVCALTTAAFAAEPRFRAHFDVAAASLVFHHIPERERAGTAAMLRARLRPGGVLVLVDVLRPAGAEINGFTEHELAVLLRDAGFGAVATELGPRITLHSQKRTRIVIAVAHS